jgi:hypothetical protein
MGEPGSDYQGFFSRQSSVNNTLVRGECANESDGRKGQARSMRGAVRPKQTIVGDQKGSEEGGLGGLVIGGGLVGGEGGGL